MSDTAFNPNTPEDSSPAPVDLSAFDDECDAVEPADNGEVPDGKYEVRVQGVKLDHSQKGDPLLKWDLVVLSGSHARRHLFKNAVITGASLPFVKGELKTLGLKMKRFSQLPSRLDELVGRTPEVTKRTKDGYTNVYFNKRIPAPASVPGRPDEAPF